MQKGSTQNGTHLTCQNQAGMTLIELLVAMTIFMVVTGSIYGLLQVAQQSRGAVSNEVQLTKAVRLGLNLIGRDTYNAGYGYPLLSTVLLRDNRVSLLLGVNADTNTARDTVPPIIAGNNITLNTFNQTPNVRTDQVTFLFKDSTFNPVGTPGIEVSQPLPVTNSTVSFGVDQLSISSGSNVRTNVNDLYLIYGSNGFTTLGVVTAKVSPNIIRFQNGDLLGFNNNGAAGEFTSINPNSIQRIKMVTYFVTAGGILTRREFVNVPPPAPAAAFVDEPLVYGVEDFQITYILDTGVEVINPSDPDGIPGNGNDDLALLSKVRQVRVSISARTTELDARGRPVQATETATFSTRNLGYEAN